MSDITWYLSFSNLLHLVSSSLCSQQHYSQQPRQEDELNIHQQVSGQTRCGACMQRDTIQPEEWNDAVCLNGNGPRDDDTKWSKLEKDRYHVISLIHRVYRLKTQNLFTKRKQTHRERIYGWGSKNRLWVWDWHIHTATFKNRQPRLYCLS